MFQGRWPHTLTLDAKNRVAIPQRVREGLFGESGGGELMVGVLQERCLYVHGQKQHQAFLERTFRHAGDTSDGRKLKRYILSRFVPVSTDSQGRVTLPQDVISRAGIQRETVLLAQDARVELWGVENFAALESEAESGALDEALEAVFREEQDEQRLLRRAPMGPAGEGEAPSR